MVNSMQEGSLSARLGITMIYGIDAVHGHNNVYKAATIFPHNIGLGVTRTEYNLDDDLLDGEFMLTGKWYQRKNIEVVCTLGGTVLVVIRLLRVIWVTVSYFELSGNSFNQGEGYYFRTTQLIT